MDAQGGEEGIDAALVEFVASVFSPLLGEVGAGSIEGLGDLEEMALGVEDVDDLDGTGKCSSARFQIQAAPSPRMTVRSASWTQRRWASRRTRRAKGDGSGSVSRLAAVSMAAL